jgi:DNA mismatch repair ATPase MutS
MRNNYTERVKQFEKAKNQLKKTSTNLAWARVIIFFIALVLITLSANAKFTQGIVITSISFVVLFLYFLKTHIGVKSKLLIQEALLKINEDEISRLDMKFSSLDRGEEFIQAIHEYHIDLDIFGKHSIFQLLNRTSTEFGRQTLAKWLSGPENQPEILKRQAAVQEVSTKLDWRQDIQAVGLAYKNEKGSILPLLDWIKTKNTILNKKFYHLAMVLMPILTIGAITLVSFGIVPTGVVALVILINMFILATTFQRSSDIYKQTVACNKVLKAYQAQIDLIEHENFNAPLLKELKSKLRSVSGNASTTIKELQFILDSLHNRSNMMYHIFNFLLLLDVVLLIKAEKWKQKTKDDIGVWFEAIGEIEVINSVGGFLYSNPTLNFPTISTTPFEIIAQKMGHPMINERKRVSNSFDFNGKGGICLITGSNMSGKSTFLRTVGVNVVLGLMGAPVCAKRMTISKLQLFTSMRTQDDLEESVSSFYAELKRLKQLLGSINEKLPTLFMVDEVLKGTNSEDRHTGATALIKQLNKAYAFGFVSTHDLALGKITTELEGIKNYSFNSVIENDDIIFDYTLTPGICKSFNATKLMQKMGIEIID